MMGLFSESHRSVHSHSEQIKIGRVSLGKETGLEMGTREEKKKESILSRSPDPEQLPNCSVMNK